jgi:phosphatidate cytidylyltransferase
MLGYRALTWITLIIFFIWGIFLFPPIVFTAIMTIVWGLAFWEWTGLLKIGSVFARFLFISLLFFLSVFAYFYFPRLTLCLGAVSWLLALYFILKFPNIPLFFNQKNVFKWILGLLMFVPCWVGFNVIRNQEYGVVFLLFVMSLIWLMDTLGYLVGRPWGKHKLLPELSPGKSIEGLVGGIIFTLLLASMVILSEKIPLKNDILTLSLILWVLFMSVIGDLFESLLKRQVNVKDSGKLLPGHGGMLDRIDSTLAAIPCFALVLPLI